MIIEDQRLAHEDLERLEQGISDRLAEDPRNVSLAKSTKSVLVDTKLQPRSRNV